MTHTETQFGEGLTEGERQLVLREQEILDSVRKAIAKERSSFDGDLARIKQRFLEARDATVGAEETDLPSLYEQMNRELSLAARQKPKPLPNPMSPYFARMTLDDGKKKREVLLGYTSLIGGFCEFPVVDWRNAPLARVFYEYRKGEEFEQELPDRILEGTVENRHVVSIEDGRLVGIQDSDISLQLIEGRWTKQDLSSDLSSRKGLMEHSSTNHRDFGGASICSSIDVSALLDPEQYEMLNAGPESPILVTGGAGSGKTTVALHRMAALGFHDAKRYHPSRCGVIVPEVGLAKLVQNILRHMRISGTKVSTYDSWLHRYGRGLFGDLPQKICGDSPAVVIAFKRHPALRFAVEAYVALKNSENPNSDPFADINETRFDLFSNLAVLQHAVDRSGGELTTAMAKQVIRHCHFQHGTDVSHEISPDLISTLDGREINDGTPDEMKGSMDLEDIPALYYLWQCVYGETESLRGGKRFNHLLLDEAQELAALDLSILGHSLDGATSATVSGDASQMTDSTSVFEGWDETLKNLGLGASVESRHLNTNYRCTVPIAELAAKVLGPLARDLPTAKRNGRPVIYSTYRQFGLAVIDLVDRLTELSFSEPRSRIAIVARNEENARRFHEHLRQDLEVRIVLDGDFSFEPGIDLTTVQNAKGLEFDYVVIPDADRGTYPVQDMPRKDLYIAVTRAIHQLWVISTSHPSELVF